MEHTRPDAVRRSLNAPPKVFGTLHPNPETRISFRVFFMRTQFRSGVWNASVAGDEPIRRNQLFIDCSERSIVTRFRVPAVSECTAAR